MTTRLTAEQRADLAAMKATHRAQRLAKAAPYIDRQGALFGQQAPIETLPEEAEPVVRGKYAEARMFVRRVGVDNIDPETLTQMMTRFDLRTWNQVSVVSSQLGRKVREGLFAVSGKTRYAWENAIKEAVDTLDAAEDLPRVREIREDTRTLTRLTTIRKRDQEAFPTEWLNAAFWSPSRKQVETMAAQVFKKGPLWPPVEAYFKAQVDAREAERERKAKAREDALKAARDRDRDLRHVIEAHTVYGQIAKLDSVCAEAYRIIQLDEVRTLLAPVKQLLMEAIRFVEKDALFNSGKVELSENDVLPTIEECNSLACYVPVVDTMTRIEDGLPKEWNPAMRSLVLGRGKSKAPVKAVRVASYIVNGNPFCYFPRTDQERASMTRFCSLLELYGLMK